MARSARCMKETYCIFLWELEYYTFKYYKCTFLLSFQENKKIQKLQHSYLRSRKSLRGDSKFLVLFYGRHFSFSSYERNKSKKNPIRTFFTVLLNSLLHALLRYWPTYNALISSEINTFRSQGFRHEFRAMLGLQRSEGESRSGLPMVNSRSYNNSVSFFIHM